jgi:hypothetical protein
MNDITIKIITALILALVKAQQPGDLQMVRFMLERDAVKAEFSTEVKLFDSCITLQVSGDRQAEVNWSAIGAQKPEDAAAFAATLAAAASTAAQINTVIGENLA